MRNLNHSDDFEEYLHDQVNDHRMYPSDRVWKNIRSRIHTPKKWPALSVFTVLIISALVIGTILNKPVPDSIRSGFAYSSQNPANIETAKNETNASDNIPVVNDKISIEQLTSKTIIAAAEKIKVEEAAAMQLSPIDQPVNTNTVALQNNALAVTNTDVYSMKNVAKQSPAITVTTVQNSTTSFKNIDNYLFDVTSRLRSILNSEPQGYSAGGVAFFSHSRNESAYPDFDLRVPAERKEFIPSLDQLGKNSSRFDFRFYITPSISYRHLKEKNQSGKSTGTSTALESDYNIDPSIAINHHPATGYETGLGIGYKLSNKFTLTGGFQFNISQYKINAFLYKDEPAALTLNEGNYLSTVNTVSSLRSIPGTTPLTIKNRYYQISMPIGIEWQILGNEKINWGLGASVQPTYTFDKQPLIISSNYKNYTDGSAYVRNWNINTNLESFFGYTTGSYRWQIGPQIRYQVLPSLVDKYPNREYLINYGLKVGVVKKLR